MNLQTKLFRVWISYLESSKYFNKIFSNIYNISLQRIVDHPNIETVFSETVHKISHKIILKYGLSSQSLCEPNVSLLSGVWKGNEASGRSWMDIESIILQSFQRNCTPEEILIDPYHKIQYKFQVIGFIYDNNIISIHPPNSSPIEIFNTITKEYLHWKNIYN